MTSIDIFLPIRDKWIYFDYNQKGVKAEGAVEVRINWSRYKNSHSVEAMQSASIEAAAAVSNLIIELIHTDPGFEFLDFKTSLS